MGVGTAAKVRVAALAATVVALAAATVLPAAPAAAEDVQALQWHLAALDIAAAQRLSTGQGVIVGVLDTGVQADHPDLAGQVLTGTDLVPPDRAKGQVDEANHGTAVAGVIAARGGAGHALGIAPGAKILPVRIRLGIPPSNLADGIHWAVDHGAKVLNISSGVEDPTDEQIEAVHYALAHDVVVVAAVGNTTEGVTSILSPASIPGVIAVGGTERGGTAWSGSVHGPEVTLAAPAADIETLSNHFASGRPGGYLRLSGTSMAAPMVAGAAALIRAKYPQLHAVDVINRLVVTADDLGAPGRDPVYGYGRLNVVKALTADVPPVSRNPLLPAPSSAAASTGHAGGLGSGATLAIAGAAALVVVVVLVAILLATRRGRRSGAARR